MILVNGYHTMSWVLCKYEPMEASQNLEDIPVVLSFQMRQQAPKKVKQHALEGTWK